MTTETPPEVARALDGLVGEYGVSVLLAREVGSRAWGLAGPSSDHDVGVVYAQGPVEYVQLGTYIESVHDEFAGVDVKAWNVKRFAELVADSNPTVLEFLGSPEAYTEHVDASNLAGYAHANFVPIDLYHHYRSLASRQHAKYVRDDAAASSRHVGGETTGGGKDPTVSRNLHLARAGLYARYVVETHAFPTLEFPVFLDGEARELDVPEESLERVRELVARKRAGEGSSEVGDPFPELAEGLPEHVHPDEHNVRGIDIERVNDFVAAAMRAASETAENQ